MSHPFDYPWSPDRGDGTFRNPVLHADYSDPDVIRHGDDFWMTASSFNCTPGLPILHSHDLVNWTLVNHAVKQVPHRRYAEVQPGCGIWAPAIRFHAGKFWIFFPMPDEGIYVTTAEDPRGEWCEPWCLQEAKGWIDPCPFWDEDGQAYLAHAYANSRAGKKERIHLRPMSPDGRRLLGEGQELFHTPHHLYLEGPKLHKLNGWYYILAPGGGVPTGWQVVFRSRNLWGPYEEKVVLERGSTGINGPHQGALVDLDDGSWMFFHFQDCGPFGRIVHLQPVTWKDGWPEVGVDYDGNGVGEPVAAWRKPIESGPEALAFPATTDEFSGSKLGLQWQWFANHDDAWASLEARPGWLRLAARPGDPAALNHAPNLLLQKFPARSFTVETIIDLPSDPAGLSAGLVVVGGNGFAALALEETPDGRRMKLRIGGRVMAEIPAEGGPLTLRVDVDPAAVCVFSSRAGDGSWHVWSPSFTPSEGGWIGAKVGLYCLGAEGGFGGGHADFEFFRFASLTVPAPHVARR